MYLVERKTKIINTHESEGDLTSYELKFKKLKEMLRGVSA